VGDRGICNFRFSTEVLLAPPLLLDHIDQSRGVCVCVCVCVFSLCVSFVKSVVTEVGHVVVKLVTTERGVGQSCSLFLCVSAQCK